MPIRVLWEKYIGKIINENRKILGKVNSEQIIAFVSSAIVAFFFLLRSPLHLWNGTETGTDSSVFKTVALMMERGCMPYKDSFDHKGPLLFIINWLGNQISYYRGVWVFELLLMTVTFFLMYKIARISSKISSAVITMFISSSLLFIYFEGGNLVEEYAMPFIALGIYIFLEYLLKDRISPVRIAMSGLAMGTVILLRPNMITVWCIFCIAILIKEIIAKDWKQIGQFILWFTIGVAICIIPIAIWLAANGALSQCVQDYIIFNMQYTTSASSDSSFFAASWSSFFTFFNTTTYIIAFAGIILNIKYNRFVNTTYTVYMVVSLIFLCMSGRTYNHYGMVLVPVTAYPISLVFSRVESVANKEIEKALYMIVSLYALSTLVAPTWIDLIETIPSSYEQKGEKGVSNVYNEMAEVISMYTGEDDAISVYGNRDFIYVYSHRQHATRYSYQFPIGQVMPEIMEEYMQQLQDELPLIIVVQEGMYDDNIEKFLKNNNYTFIWGQNGEFEDGGMLIYCRDQ